jgi:hypothetical protein
MENPSALAEPYGSPCWSAGETLTATTTIGSTQTMMIGKMRILIVRMKIIHRSGIYRLRAMVMFRNFKEGKRVWFEGAKE